jgi:hypothetical protein
MLRRILLGKTLGKLMRMRNCLDDNIKIKAVDESGSGSCPLSGFGTDSVEPSGSATRELVNSKIDRREIGCEDGSGCNWLRIVSNGGICY